MHILHGTSSEKFTETSTILPGHTVTKQFQFHMTTNEKNVTMQHEDCQGVQPSSFDSSM